MIDNLNINKSNWKLVKLSDVASTKSIRVNNPKESKYERFIGSSCINERDMKVKKWDSSDSVISAMKGFESGDYLFVRRSTHGIEFKKRVPRADFDGICSGDIIPITENKELIHDGFLIGVLYSKNFWKHVISNASGSITSRVKWKDLAEYQFLLPPKDQQAKIAKLLWAMDDVVEKEKEVYTKTDISFKSIAKVIADIDKYHSNEYKKIKDVTSIKDNLRKPLNSSQRSKMQGDIPYYGANGLVDYLDNYIFDEELVLIAEDGGNFSEFYKKPIAYKVNGKSWVNNHAHVLTAKNSESINNDWLYYSLVHKNVIKYVIGTTRVKLNKSELENIQIWCPEREKQDELIAEIIRIEKIRTESGNQIENSKQLQKSLINEIFSE